MRVPVGAVIVNATGRGSCARCRADVAREARELPSIARAARAAGATAIVTPEQTPPPAGHAALALWARTWRVPPCIIPE
jgi:hypothetical protein